MNLNVIKSTAYSFNKAYDRCFENRQLPDGSLEILAVPMVVNLAFSAELYLKYLIAKTGKSKTGHELDKLFNSLDSTIQNEIMTKINYSNEEFDKLLKNNSQIFADWRYIFEKTYLKR